MASIIKADNIQKVSDGSNIIKKCGSTITVGSSGQTVALASGASQTGFGTPTSSVLWCTTAKTSPFTAADQKGYFVNTSGGAVTVTLPSSPSAGDVVAVKDYANTFQTNAVTLANNSSKINGTADNAILSTQDQSVTLVYVDGTQGWRVVNDSTSEVAGGSFIAASGGTVLTCGDFKTHVFTSSATFCVSAGTGPIATAEYLVVAGGGGGGRGDASGGGAGGFRYFSALSPAGSPLVSPAGITISAQGYPITVGSGGSGSPSTGAGSTGANSVFGSITSAGGGGGGSGATNGLNGGSGGGATGSRTKGNGNTPPTSPPQGQDGTAGPSQGGGGGGAGGVGGPSPGTTGGKGGLGSYVVDGFFGPTAPSYGTSGPVSSTKYFSGGAGGHGDSVRGAAPDGGGGGQGSLAPGCGSTAGTANTGGGGGGAQPGPSGKNGGSGFVAIRYKFQ